MRKNRLTILKHFTVNEAVKLVLGKLFLNFRDEPFKNLQERENKLAIILRTDPSAQIKGNEVIVNHIIDSTTYYTYLRLEGSDVWVFQQVLINESYHVVLEAYRNHFGKSPKLIIDAGANIGMSVLYFKAKYPDLNIIAIEPDNGNFNYAKKNVINNHLSSVILHQAALWPTKTKMEIVNDFRDKNDWSLRVEENSDGQITSVTPHEMVLSFNGEVDIFKIDIEGGEARIFELTSDLSWLNHVRVIAIEIHDEFSDKEKIIQLLESYEFKIFEKGELTIGVSNGFEKE